MAGVGNTMVVVRNTTVFVVITAVPVGNTTVFVVITMVALGNTIVCAKNELLFTKSPELRVESPDLRVSGGSSGGIGSWFALFLDKIPSILVTAR